MNSLKIRGSSRSRFGPQCRLRGPALSSESPRRPFPAQAGSGKIGRGRRASVLFCLACSGTVVLRPPAHSPVRAHCSSRYGAPPVRDLPPGGLRNKCVSDNRPVQVQKATVTPSPGTWAQDPPPKGPLDRPRRAVPRAAVRRGPSSADADRNALPVLCQHGIRVAQSGSRERTPPPRVRPPAVASAVTSDDGHGRRGRRRPAVLLVWAAR